VPGITRVAVLLGTSGLEGPRCPRDAGSGAQILGVQLQPLEVGRPEDFEGAFAAAAREHADALLILGSPATVIYRLAPPRLGGHSRLPAMYDKKEFVREWRAHRLYAEPLEHGRRNAYYVDRVLKRRQGPRIAGGAARPCSTS